MEIILSHTYYYNWSNHELELEEKLYKLYTDLSTKHGQMLCNEGRASQHWNDMRVYLKGENEYSWNDKGCNTIYDEWEITIYRISENWCNEMKEFQRFEKIHKCIVLWRGKENKWKEFQQQLTQFIYLTIIVKVETRLTQSKRSGQILKYNVF